MPLRSPSFEDDDDEPRFSAPLMVVKLGGTTNIYKWPQNGHWGDTVRGLWKGGRVPLFNESQFCFGRMEGTEEKKGGRNLNSDK